MKPHVTVVRTSAVTVGAGTATAEQLILALTAVPEDLVLVAVERIESARNEPSVLVLRFSA